MMDGGIVSLVRQIVEVHDLVTGDLPERVVLPPRLIARLRADMYRALGSKDPYWLDDRGELRIYGVVVVADTPG